MPITTLNNFFFEKLVKKLKITIKHKLLHFIFHYNFAKILNTKLREKMGPGKYKFNLECLRASFGKVRFCYERKKMVKSSKRYSHSQ